MERPFHLMLLPGLGADQRMFEPQRQSFPDLEVPSWIDPQRREPLAHYAERLADKLERPQPLVLGGVSLGGMVAWELARLLKPKALVLIASCRTPRSIAPWARMCGMVGGLIPSAVIEGTKPLAVLTAGRLAGAGQFSDLCLRMYRDSDSRFMRWAALAVHGWQPSPAPDCPVFQTHGACDRIIPASRVPADLLVPGGGHMINLTHAEAVNRFIAEVAEKSL
jgi:pimeloyl-ACP methyl ester carboxylesterase